MITNKRAEVEIIFDPSAGAVSFVSVKD